MKVDSRNRAIVLGGLIGGLIGVAATWLYLRWASEEAKGETPPGEGIRLRDVARLGWSILGVLRQIAAMKRRRA
ncbi:MAG: hypothetical protein ACE5JL_17345 [Dehalococcoidia bacterium]